MQLVNCLLIAEVFHLNFVVFGLDRFEELAVFDSLQFAEIGLVELLGVEVVSPVVQRQVGRFWNGHFGSFALQRSWVRGEYFSVCGVLAGTRRALSWSSASGCGPSSSARLASSPGRRP